jgi:hypothetical protein
MFQLELRRGDETRSFSIKNVQLEGWELSEEKNRCPVRRVQYRDWHRVERAIAWIRYQAELMQQEGWEDCVVNH